VPGTLLKAHPISAVRAVVLTAPAIRAPRRI